MASGEQVIDGLDGAGRIQLSDSLRVCDDRQRSSSQHSYMGARVYPEVIMVNWRGVSRRHTGFSRAEVGSYC